MIKNNIKYTILTCFKDKYFLAVKVCGEDGEVIFATHYSPFDKNQPNTPLPLADLNKLLSLNIPFYFLGDLNAKHSAFGHSSSDAKGKQLNQLCMRRRELLYLGPSFKTFVSGTRQGKPDIILSNIQASQYNTYIESGPLLDSDHRVINLKVSVKPIPIKLTTPTYNMEEANWDKYKQTLEAFVVPNLDNKDYTILDEMWELAINAIVNAAKISIPYKTHLIFKNSISPSHKTKTISLSYKNICNLHMLHPSPNLLQQSRMLLSDLKDSWREDIDRYYNKLANKAEKHFKHEPAEFFKVINKFRGNYSAPTTYLRHDGTIHSGPTEILGVFRGVWEEIHHPNPIEPHAEDHIEDVEGWCLDNEKLINPHKKINFSSLESNNKLTTPITAMELGFVIDDLKKKAPGESGIGQEMIKNLPRHFREQLLYLYNATLASGYMPKSFKSSITVLIPKKEDTTNPKNYRPIALLETLAKLYETIIYRRLKLYLEENDLLDPDQFGFRPGRSTHHVVNILLNYIQTNRRRKRDVLLISKDVEKAFDTVWREGLIYKVFNSTALNIPPLIAKTIASYLTDRTVKIKYGHNLASPFSPQAGVPQGSVLAPLLYLIYLNDKPDTIRNRDNPATETLNLLYADDNNIAISCGMKNLFLRATHELQRMSDWEAKWRIKININKSKILLFGPNRIKLMRRLKSFNPFTANPLHPERGGVPIPIATTHTILGIKFDSALTFVPCVSQLRRTVDRSRKSFLCLIKVNNRLREFLYKCYILPKILYHYPIYSFLSQPQAYKLQGSQNRCIRRFIYTYAEMGNMKASDSHVLTRLLAINNVMHKRAKKNYTKIEKYLPYWHQSLIDWHGIPTRNYVHQNTPMDWAKKPPNRPIYSKRSHQRSLTSST